MMKSRFAELENSLPTATMDIDGPIDSRIIILAEDSLDTRLEVTCLLNWCGVRYIFTDDLDEVIKLANIHTPRLIIVDPFLPSLEGVDLAMQLRQTKNATRLWMMTLKTQMKWKI